MESEHASLQHAPREREHEGLSNDDDQPWIMCILIAPAAHDGVMVHEKFGSSLSVGQLVYFVVTCLVVGLCKLHQ